MNQGRAQLRRWGAWLVAVAVAATAVMVVVVVEAPPAEAGTFPVDINDVLISPTGHPEVCWSTTGIFDKADIALATCNPASFRQRWNVTTDDQFVLTGDPSLCLDNFLNSSFSDGRQLNITDACGVGSAHATWPYQLFSNAFRGTPAGAIYNTYAGLCANASGNSFTPGTFVVRWDCSTTAANEKWSIGSADFAVTGTAVSGKPGASVVARLDIENLGPQTGYFPSLSITSPSGFAMSAINKANQATT